MDETENIFYDLLSEKAKEVAPKIEALLNGLTIDEIGKLLRAVKIRLAKQAVVTTLG